ncbi:hypothetical protein DAY19_14415 [Halobacteriovorax vibrionivorans]|uniref:Uncharacterized protein n=1 Tax=Halobacteriovorax vibrionivorans TaxID=2152716 RepID=A0ABY0IGC6_9BACT|nr:MULTISPECIES: hypothetical protein [Halobacteriovorax]RZF21168.1 hypothetical protein DAY19_14415 [Halobacteriovorax vibrionivorans]TGD46071.1 hypothetical protein EP118_13470 [Halobacteriovorax sp. Y22]
MQAHKLKKVEKYNLSQGTIFEISKLRLEINGRKRAIRTIYPEVNFKNIKYAVLLTQSCDLVNDLVFEKKGGKLDKGPFPQKYKYRTTKVPHLTFCLLEPIDKFIDRFTTINKDDFIIDLDDYIDGLSSTFNVDIFSKERALVTIEKEVERLLQNNHPWAFFVSLPPKSKKQYFFANLTKILPVKVTHYESILDLAEFQLSGEFSDKLAWKLASLYGRVGTKDYSSVEIKKISSDIFTIVENKVFGLSKKFTDFDSDTFKKLKKELNKAKSSATPEVNVAQAIKNAFNKDT